MRRFFAAALAAPALLLLLGRPSLAPAQPAATPECGGPPSSVRLIVQVENLRSSQGLVAVTLYPDVPRRFLANRGALYVVRVPAVAPTTRVCIHLPALGAYALGVYHDANANRRFNRTRIGFPAESFGFSNNPRLFLGIPAFNSVRFVVPRSGMRATIRLRHP